MPSENGHTTITQPEITLHLPQREQISDLIGNPPGWILRSGITIIAIVIAGLLTGAFFIEYPDKIECSGIITTENPPIEIIPQRPGIVKQVLVENKREVNQGDRLLYFENTANPVHVDTLHAILQKDIIGLQNQDFPDNLTVGELSPTYSSLLREINTYRQLLRQTSVDRQVQTIAQEINEIKQLNQSLRKEKELFATEMRIVEKDLARNQELNKEKVVSDLDLEQAEKNHLQYRRQYESMQSGIIQNNIQIEKLTLQSYQLLEERKNQLENQRLIMADLQARLTAEIKKWYETNYLTAEYPGVIEWNSTITTGKVIQSGSIAGYIIPSGAQNTKIVKALVPTTGAGKVEVGDKAIIRYQAFPYKEYGSLETQVSSISAIPQQISEEVLAYEVMLTIPDPMITDYGEEISYTPNMDVTIQLITESNNIIGRIFNQLYSIIKNT